MSWLEMIEGSLGLCLVIIVFQVTYKCGEMLQELEVELGLDGVTAIYHTWHLLFSNKCVILNCFYFACQLWDNKQANIHDLAKGVHCSCLHIRIDLC